MMDNYGNVLNYNDFCLKKDLYVTPNNFTQLLMPYQKIWYLQGFFHTTLCHSLSHLFVWITCLLEIINVTTDILEVSSLVDLIQIELDVTIFSKILTRKR